MKRLTEFGIRVRLWYHWRQVTRYRKKGLTLLEGGESFSSERIIALSRKIDRHGAIALRLEKQRSMRPAANLCDRAAET